MLIKINVNIYVDDNFLNNIMEQSYSSIGYWLEEGGWNIIKNAENDFTLVDVHGDVSIKGKKYVLNAKTIERGFKRYIEWRSKTNRTLYYEGEDLDTEEMDVIIQLGLFNEIIFG